MAFITASSMRIGIIGGSGLDDETFVSDPEVTYVETPFGEPSAPPTKGKIGNVEVLVLPRHGLRHQFSPTEVNNRANIWALKEAGATHILATTACGSLREEIRRGDLVLLDQFIDFTRHRVTTFHTSFENGSVHTAMADPFDLNLRNALKGAVTQLGFRYHGDGTVITIEGPRFSSRAESHMFRAWGADVINMSVAPEVILANEIGIPYAAVAMSTDYDCWKEDEAPVTWEDILKVFKSNASKVKQLLRTAIESYI